MRGYLDKLAGHRRSAASSTSCSQSSARGQHATCSTASASEKALTPDLEAQAEGDPRGTSPRASRKRSQMPSLKRPPQPHRQRQVDAQDHARDADRRGVEAEARAGSGRGRAPLRREDASACSPTSRRASRDKPGAPKLLAGTGTRRRPSARRDDGRSRPLRRLQHQHRASSRASAFEALLREGKTVKILCVGRKGRDQLKRHLSAS